MGMKERQIYGDERTTNCRIIDSVIVPLIEKMR